MRSTALLPALALALTLTAPDPAFAQARNVVINTVRLPDSTVRRLEQQYRVSLVDGKYWYDRGSGAWGLQNGPTAGFTLPGLTVGGRLHPDASAGNTGVFINGRQLHQSDVMALMTIMPVYQGRYWMDGSGNFGQEGGPPLGNLWMAVQAAGRQGGSKSTYNRDGSMFGSDGNGCTVFNDPSTHTSYSSPGC
jgi:hypothetical protein